MEEIQRQKEEDQVRELRMGLQRKRQRHTEHTQIAKTYVERNVKEEDGLERDKQNGGHENGREMLRQKARLYTGNGRRGELQEEGREGGTAGGSEGGNRIDKQEYQGSEIMTNREKDCLRSEPSPPPHYPNLCELPSSVESLCDSVSPSTNGDQSISLLQ